MKKSFKKNTREGLPNGPNEIKTTQSGFIISERGQWDFPGLPTMIPSNNITMKDVPYPVFGFDDLGYSQMMYPGMDYKFPGNQVYELPIAQVGKENKVPSYEDLYKEYNIVQSQVNDYLRNNKGREEERNYRLRLNDTANKLIEQGIDVREEGYIPDHIKNSPEFRADCISGTCRILNEIGEPTKYYSNTLLQDDVIAGKVPGRTFDYSVKGIVPGDILQFKSDEKSYPFHAYLIQDISEPDAKGNRTVKVAGSSGNGPLRNEIYILTPDNKITDTWGNPRYVQTIRRERFDKNPVPNDLLKRRDELKSNLEKYYPNAFKNFDVDTDAFKPTAFIRNNNNKLNLGNPGFPSETINLDESKLDEILIQFSDPDFKSNFMKQQKVSNDEYDAIVKNVIGIYGAESKFGTGYGREPLWLQKFLAGPKGIQSVGPFQINPKMLKTKRFSRNDLFDPILGSEAAAIFLAENLPLLRNRAGLKPGDDHYSENLNKDNYLEYIPYLMNQQGLLLGDNYTEEEKPGRMARFFGADPTPTPENKLTGDSEYNQAVKRYIENLGVQAIPASMSNPVTISDYQDGGIFNPNTDEFIGFVDELPKAQDGEETKAKPITNIDLAPIEITAKRTIWDKLKGFARQFPGVDFDEYQRSKALQEKYQNAWFPESPKNLQFIEQRALEDGKSAYRPSTLQFNPITGEIMPASGRIDPDDTFDLALLPASLPFKATSRLGKIGLGAIEMVNPISGFKGLKPKNITSSVNDVSKDFKSEIDWGKWNAEIPENKVLMNEYNAIEQTTKANGTWMKNSDGSPFQGTPEQFVQQNSENFKRAFPEGFETTYRGGDINPELNTKYNKNADVVFTTKDQYGAKVYNRMYRPYDPLSKTEAPPRGITELYMPKTENKLTLSGENVDIPFTRRNYARLDLINQVPKTKKEAEILKDLQDYLRYNKALQRGSSETAPYNLSDWVMTDNIADFLSTPKGKTVDRIEIEKILDGTIDPIDVEIHNLSNKKQLKSMWNNNGMFDMTNPNIYKAIIPAAIGIGTLKQNNQSQKQAYGGYIYDNGGSTGDDDKKRMLVTPNGLVAPTLNTFEVIEERTPLQKIYDEEFQKRLNADKAFQEKWYPGQEYDPTNIEKRAVMAANDKVSKYIINQRNKEGKTRNSYANRQEFLKALTDEEKKYIGQSNLAGYLEPDAGSRFRAAWHNINHLGQEFLNTDPDLTQEEANNISRWNAFAPLGVPLNALRATLTGDNIGEAFKGETSRPWMSADEQPLASGMESTVPYLNTVGDFGMDPLNFSGMGIGQGLGKMVNPFNKFKRLNPNITSSVDNISGNSSSILELFGQNSSHEDLASLISNQVNERIKFWESPTGRSRLQKVIDETPELKKSGITVEKYIDDLKKMEIENKKAIDIKDQIINIKQARKEFIEDWERAKLDNDIGEYSTSGLTQEMADDIIRNYDKNIEKLNDHYGSLFVNNMYSDNAFMYGLTSNNSAINLFKNPIIEDVYNKRYLTGIGRTFTLGDAKRIGRHEIGHFVQRGVKTNLDKELSKLKLADTESSNLFNTATGSNPEKTVAYKDVFNKTGNYFKKAKEYFKSGSKGREKLPFLEEVRADMLEKGIIKDLGDPITEKMMIDHYNNYMLEGFNNKYPLRLYDIMKNDKSNFKLLTSVINRMPAVVPVIGGTGILGVGALQGLQSDMPGYKHGGSKKLKKVKTKYKQGGSYNPNTDEFLGFID
jgi:hypothetical protein